MPARCVFFGLDGVTVLCGYYNLKLWQVIRESAGNNQTGERPFYDYLESCLRHKAEMVILEAARAITELQGVTNRELTPAITVLQLFLSSSKPVLRFAAVRTLNKVISSLSACISVFIRYACIANIEPSAEFATVCQ